MGVSGVGTGADLMGAISLAGQGAAASAASMGVLKKALDASEALGADLVALASGVNNSGGQLNVYA